MPQDQQQPVMNDEEFAQAFYANPRQMLRHLGTAVANQLRGEFAQHQAAEAHRAQVADVHRRLFRAYPHLASERAETLDFISQEVGRNADLANMTDLDEGIERLGELATEHLKRRRGERVAEEERAMLQGFPGTDSEDVEPDVPDRDHSLSAIIARRRAARRSRGRAA